MSLMLGIFSKYRSLNKEDVKKVISGFSIDEKTNINNKYSGKKIFLTATEAGNIAQHDNLILMFSGDIYDYKKDEARLKDMGYKIKNRSEFMLFAYMEYGSSFLKGLNGNFAFALYDRNKHDLLLANDSFGIYPLFVYDMDDICIFCSDYEAITRYRKFDRTMDNDAIAQYFVFGLPLDDRTFFRYIRNLSPGSLMNISESSTESERYDELDIRIEKDKSIDYFAEKISIVFRKAVQDRVKDRENLVCELSGGADTRLVLSCLSRSQRRKIEFVTYNTLPIKEDLDKDVIIAKMLAERLGLRHRVNKIKKKYEILDICQDKIKGLQSNIITSLCGGEFLGGDCYGFSTVKIEGLNRKFVEEKTMIFNKEFRNSMSSPLTAFKKTLDSIKAENKYLMFYINQYIRGFFTSIYRGYGSGFLMPCSNILSMDSPYWDKNFLKTLLTIPEEILQDYRLYNKIYSDHFPELIDIPTNSPLTLRQDSCMRYLDKGIDRKSLRRRFPQAYKSCVASRMNDFYEMDHIRKLHKDLGFLKFWILIERMFFNKSNHQIYHYRKLFSPAMNNAKKLGSISKIISNLHKKKGISRRSDSIINSFAHFETWCRNNV